MVKVVIVDDEINLLVGTSLTLEESIDDIETSTFDDATKAFDYLKCNKVDILICDINMPKLNGINLVKKVIDFQENLKILFLTAYSDFDYAYEVLKIPNCKYILKLEDDDVIIAAINEFITLIKHENLEKEAKIKNRLNAYKYEQYYTHKALKLYLTKSITLEELKESFEYEKFNKSQVAQIYLTSKIEKELKRTEEKDKIKLLCEEIVVCQFLKVLYMSDTEVFLIINCVDNLRQTLEKIQNYISERLNLTSVICYNENFITLEELPDVYNQISKKTMKYRYVKDLMLFSINAFIDEFSIKEFKQLKVNISDDYKIIESEILRIYKEVMNNDLTYHQAISLYLKIYFELINRFLSMGYDNKEVFNNDSLTDSFLFVSIESMKQNLEHILKQFKKFSKDESYLDGYNMIRKLENFVLQNIQKDISLERLAEEVNYNPSYLSRYYKTITKKNISSFVRDIKLQKAKELLENNDLLIKDIANEVGFISVSYFCSFFQKNLGLTPQSYRLKLTGQN